MSEPKDGVYLATGTEVEEFFKKGGLSHFIGRINPPRHEFVACIKALEFTHYPPATERNALFSIVLLKWHEIEWAIVSIPSTDYNLMRDTALRHDLCIVRSVPIAFKGDDVHHFPVQARRLYTLEGLARPANNS